MISTYQKLGLGAIGGLCLGLLKLMSANFYLGAASSSVVVGAYLTYGAYLILGMAVGALFCEQFPNDINKTRKSAFLMGLLAPSMLIAIITKPIGGSDEESGRARDIPSISLGLSNFLLSSAHAQSPTATTSPSTTGSTIESPSASVTVVTKSDVVPGIDAGIKSALGVQTAAIDSLFVVAKTTNETQAVRTADDINALFRNRNEAHLKALVIKPQGSDEFFVTVNSVTSAKDASETEGKVKGAAITTLTAPASDSEEKAAAKRLLRGDVYRSKALIKAFRW